ncbi:hypothetical protein GPECTOR_13g848 [Gonium pectorale]|uniref:Uncharacterized protein n=1 Tax=Gonium pectorale TaxID=33097 RepID=A0A150GNF9_GONPE|nr:hypothetical protein GPECTOR_13g848 [Gonium pectorale]|eukprot:KXZ51359.1 hypothetical protein GPECTOR_13g848 [Gonium pectorale]
MCRLRLSGGKNKHERPIVPDTVGQDAVLAQGHQIDQQEPGPVAGPSPFSRGDAAVASCSGPLRTSAGAGPAPIQAQRSAEAALPPQQSWGSPRSDAVFQGDVGLSEGSARPCAASAGGGTSSSAYGSAASSLGGMAGSQGGGGSGTSAGGGCVKQCSRPPGVPPLDMARLHNEEEARRRGRRRTSSASAAPPGAAHSPAPGTPGLLPAVPQQLQQQLSPGLFPHGTPASATAASTSSATAGADALVMQHVELLESLAEMEAEICSWAAPPKWNPTQQGRWYLYPPIGRKDVSPVEALVESLAPRQAAGVVALWRQYAAARYSAELMAGRAVRLCKELTRELGEARAEADEHVERTTQMAHTIRHLQHQLQEARTAVEAATRRPDSGKQGPPAGADSPTRHHASAQPAVGAGPGGERPTGPIGRVPTRGEVDYLTQENVELTAQLEQMREMFLEAHDDTQVLRDALAEADDRNRRLAEQSSELRRQAGAALKENAALRRELAAFQQVSAAGRSPSALATSAEGSATTSPPATASGRRRVAMALPVSGKCGGSSARIPLAISSPAAPLSGSSSSGSKAAEVEAGGAVGPGAVVRVSRAIGKSPVKPFRALGGFAGAPGGGGSGGSSGGGAMGGSGPLGLGARGLSEALAVEGVVAVVEATGRRGQQIPMAH